MAIASPVHPSIPTPNRISIDDFVRKYSGEYVELIDGIVVELPMPGLTHGEICANLAFELTLWVRKQQLGRIVTNDSFIRTRSNPDRIRGADVAFLSYANYPKDQPLPPIATIPPELIVEVRSPSDRWIQLVEKANEYLDAGIQVVLLIDPESQQVHLYQQGIEPVVLGLNDELALPNQLPGFSTSVRKFFE
jgi:Uma2 family endonuclease